MSIDDNFRPFVRLERRDRVQRHNCKEAEESWVFVGLDPDKNARFELLFLEPAPKGLAGQGSAAAPIGTRDISIVAGEAAFKENAATLRDAKLEDSFRVELSVEVESGIGKVTTLRLTPDCK